MPDSRNVQRAEVLAGRQAGLLSYAQVLQEGLTRGDLRQLLVTGRWQRQTRGVYRTPVVPLDDRYDMARHQMAWTGLLAVPGGVATGMAAVALHRIQGLPQRIPAEVCLPGGTSQRGPKGIRVRRYRSGMSVLEIGGFPVADVTVAIAQALRDLDREHGVAVLDSALHLGRLHAGTLREVNDLLVGCPGVRKARSYLVLADGRADSPLETWARLVFTDAGLPPSTLQKEFLDDRGRRIAKGDLAWRRSDGSWVSVEMDGQEVHSAPDAVFRDRHRQNDLMLDRALTLLRFTGRDLRDGSAVAMLRTALGA